MNFLNEYPKVRKWLYFVQWVINGVFAVLGAYFVAIQTPVDELPGWYVVPLAVAPVLWTYLGLQAGANVPRVDSPPPPSQAADSALAYYGQHRKTDGGYAILGALGLGLVVLTVILLVLTVLNVVNVGWVALAVLFVVGLVLMLIDSRHTGRVR